MLLVDSIVIEAIAPEWPIVSVTAPPVYGEAVVVLPAPGPRGIPGASGAGHIHEQTTPATVWNITHDLHRMAVIAAVYSADYSIEWGGVVVQPMTINTCRLSFDDPTAGIAYIT